MRIMLIATSAESIRLKILCLHGGGEDASQFRASVGMVGLESSLASSVEFVYATAPYSRSLWIRDPPGGKSSPTTDPNWASQSVALLDSIVQSQGPFHGLLGYSQGSAMALTYLTSVPLSTFQVVILFCGYVPTTHTGLTNRINTASPFGGIPALIWIGRNDPIISNAQSQNAAAMFTSPSVLISQSGGHAVPDSSDPTYGDVVRFIRLSASDSSLPPAPPALPPLPPRPLPASLAPSLPVSPSGDDGLSSGTVAGIVVGAVACLSAATWLVLKAMGGKWASPPTFLPTIRVLQQVEFGSA